MQCSHIETMRTLIIVRNFLSRKAKLAMLFILLATTAEFSPSSGHYWVETFLKSPLCLHILGFIIYEEYIKNLGRVRRKSSGVWEKKEKWRVERRRERGRGKGRRRELCITPCGVSGNYINFSHRIWPMHFAITKLVM